MSSTLPLIPAMTVLVASLIAAVTDVWQFKVPNRLTVPVLFSGMIYHAVDRGGLGFVESALGAIFGFFLLIAFFLLGGMGAGDVKLMAAIGAWLGLKYTFFVFIASSLAAGCYSLVLLLTFGRMREMWVNLQIFWFRVAAIGHHIGAEDRVETELKRTDRRQRAIPFAAMVAVGLIAMLLWCVVKSN